MFLKPSGGVPTTDGGKFQQKFSVVEKAYARERHLHEIGITQHSSSKKHIDRGTLCATMSACLVRSPWSVRLQDFCPTQIAHVPFSILP
jgi:hypothetical protein